MSAGGVLACGLQGKTWCFWTVALALLPRFRWPSPRLWSCKKYPYSMLPAAMWHVLEAGYLSARGPIRCDICVLAPCSAFLHLFSYDTGLGGAHTRFVALFVRAWVNNLVGASLVEGLSCPCSGACNGMAFYCFFWGLLSLGCSPFLIFTASGTIHWLGISSRLLHICAVLRAVCRVVSFVKHWT